MSAQVQQKRPVAVLVVHGIADQVEGETARMVADMAPAVRVRRTFVVPRAEKLASEEGWTGRLLGRFKSTAPTFSSVVFEAEKPDDGDIWELYWSDLGRIQSFWLAFFAQILTLLFHLPMLGSLALETPNETRGWRRMRWIHRFAVEIVTAGVPLLNLAMFVVGTALLGDALAGFPAWVGGVAGVGCSLVAIAAVVGAGMLGQINLKQCVAGTLLLLVVAWRGVWQGPDFWAATGVVCLALVAAFALIGAYESVHKWASYVGAIWVLLALVLLAYFDEPAQSEALAFAVFRAIEVLNFIAVALMLPLVLAALPIMAWATYWAVQATVKKVRESGQTPTRDPQATLRARATRTAVVTLAIGSWGLFAIGVPLWMTVVQLTTGRLASGSVIPGLPAWVQQHALLVPDVSYTPLFLQASGTFRDFAATLGGSALAGAYALSLLALFMTLAPLLLSAVPGLVQDLRPAAFEALPGWIARWTTAWQRMLHWAALAGTWMFVFAFLVLEGAALVDRSTAASQSPYLSQLDMLVAWGEKLLGPFFTTAWLGSSFGTVLVLLVIRAPVPLRQVIDLVRDVDIYLRAEPATGTPHAAIAERFQSLLRLLEQKYDRVVVVAHSQGTVIAHDNLVRLGSPRVVTQLITFGSPLRQLYGRFLPAGYGKASGRVVLATPWSNLYGEGDYVGRWVDASTNTSIGASGHLGYWKSVAVARAVASAVRGA